MRMQARLVLRARRVKVSADTVFNRKDRSLGGDDNRARRVDREAPLGPRKTQVDDVGDGPAIIFTCSSYCDIHSNIADESPCGCSVCTCTWFATDLMQCEYG